MDNACIHHSKIVTEYIKNYNIKLIFNVPYSPEYNPIEIMFSKLKKLVKDYTDNNKIKILELNIIDSLIKITSKDLNNFFNYSLNNLRIS